MQVTVSKQRFDLGRFKLAALVIGSAGALAIGAATYVGLQDDASQTAPAVAPASTQLHPADAYRLEQEMLMNELYHTGYGAEGLGQDYALDRETGLVTGKLNGSAGRESASGTERSVPAERSNFPDREQVEQRSAPAARSTVEDFPDRKQIVQRSVPAARSATDDFPDRKQVVRQSLPAAPATVDDFPDRKQHTQRPDTSTHSISPKLRLLEN